MSFQKITWVDRRSEHPTRRRLVTIDTQQEYGVFDVERSEGTVSQEGTPYNADYMNQLQTNIENAFIEVDNNIASAYDETATYTEGDFCIYEGVLYQANQDISVAEEWDSDHWDSVKLTDIMGTGSASIDDEVVADDKTWSSKHIASFLPTDTASGAIAHFTDGAEAIPVKSLTAEITPIQAGSGTPSPSNPRSISGRTEVNITRCNSLADFISNLNSSSHNLTISEANGAIKFTGQPDATYASLTSDFNCFIPNGATITLSRNVAKSYRLYIRVTYDDNTTGNIVIYADTTSITATLTKNVIKVRLDLSNMSTSTNYNETIYVQLQGGSTQSTTFDPYTGELTTIDLGTTVYGGTLDVTRGKLTIINKGIDLSSLSWTSGYITERLVYYTELSDAKIVPNSDIFNGIAERYVPIRYNGISTADYLIALRNNGVLYVSGENPTGKLVYELATPTEIDLTPEEVTTLLGENNIFADSGNVEVVYRADIKKYIDKKTS